MSQGDGYEKLACMQVVGVYGPASGEDGPDESDAIEDAGDSIWWGGSIDMSEGINSGCGSDRFSNIPW